MGYIVLDGGPVWAGKHGISNALFTSADASTAAAATEAPTTGEKIVITDVVISVAAAMEIAIEEETSGTELLKFHLPQDGSIHVSPRTPIVLPTANKKAMVDTDTAGSVSVTICYYSTNNGIPYG